MPVVEVDQETFDGLLRVIEREEQSRARDMPTEQDALIVMFRAWTRLREMGWREAIYCPKDGSVFRVICAGSTGTFDCHYQGEWPHGTWLVHDGGDLWPERPILFKPKGDERGRVT